MINQELFIKNRKKFVDHMEDQSLLVLFAGEAKHRSADDQYPFTPNRHFYYLTGIDREDFILLITKQNGKTKEKLFILKPDPAIERWVGTRLRDDEASEISGIELIDYTENFMSVLLRTLQTSTYQTIYLDTEYREGAFVSKGLEFAEFVQKKIPYLQIKSADQIVSDLRTIKEPEEVDAIKRAIGITQKGLEEILTHLRPGLIERQVEAYYDFAIKYHGSPSVSFKTIAASGLNATVLHYSTNDTVTKDGELILFDLGCEYDYYCSDISRTYPVNGVFTDRQREVYEAVLKVNESLIEYLKPGITWMDYQMKGRELLSQAAIDLGLITDASDVSKYYYHGIGHYLGLDVHDVGRYDRKLEPGMVVTVEPGLYIEEEAIGVRIEDDILITEDGCVNLSKDIIKSVDDIEAFMKNIK